MDTLTSSWVPFRATKFPNLSNKMNGGRIVMLIAIQWLLRCFMIFAPAVAQLLKKLSKSIMPHGRSNTWLGQIAINAAATFRRLRCRVLHRFLWNTPSAQSTSVRGSLDTRYTMPI
jgi:hypothetical protein